MDNALFCYANEHYARYSGNAAVYLYVVADVKLIGANVNSCVRFK